VSTFARTVSAVVNLRPELREEVEEHVQRLTEGTGCRNLTVKYYARQVPLSVPVLYIYMCLYLHSYQD
jgi:hypothetical protein